MIDRISGGRRRNRSVDGGSFAEILLLTSSFLHFGMIGDSSRQRTIQVRLAIAIERDDCPSEKNLWGCGYKIIRQQRHCPCLVSIDPLHQTLAATEIRSVAKSKALEVSRPPVEALEREFELNSPQRLKSCNSPKLFRPAILDRLPAHLARLNAGSS